jgi:hypothetical protein
MKIRKIYDVKVNIAEISEFIGCNPKGIYYIERSFEEIKAIRYLMYMRKAGLNVNKILDNINENEKLKKAEKE